ncbi:MAG: hypothetical protein JXB29_04065 [Sedimentisphaerales bacterium]|nr:hypothetical protein [Sedimentisphaerales bacterium]
MCNKGLFVVFLILSLVLVNMSLADVLWSGAGSDNLWSTPQNWAPKNIVPTSNDVVVIESSENNPLIKEGIKAYAKAIKIRTTKAAKPATLTVTGGNLNVTSYVRVGLCQKGEDGILNISGGRIDANWLEVSSGKGVGMVNMGGPGGYINIAMLRIPRRPGQSGSINLDVGVITTKELMFAARSERYVNISGGKLVITAEKIRNLELKDVTPRELIAEFVRKGRISGCKGECKIAIDDTTVAGKTIVTAVKLEDVSNQVFSNNTANSEKNDWTYKSGTLVGAYYYPWYNDSKNWGTNTVRWHLAPLKQQPALGWYDSSEPNVIAAHIEQSIRGNVHFWVIEWWGKEPKDDVFKKCILTHKDAGKLRYAIHYVIGFGTPDNPDFSRLFSDFKYFADNYFNNPNYLKIDGRSVVVFYQSDSFTGEKGYTALTELRKAFPNVYIVGNNVGWSDYKRFERWDAITSYDAPYGIAQVLGSTRASIEKLKSSYHAGRSAAEKAKIGFIPCAMPGFTKLRMGGVDFYAAPHYLEDDPKSVEGDWFRVMLREAVVPTVDPSTSNMLMVTSFNEWYEDSAIEPTAGTNSRTNKDDSEWEDFYTQGTYYTDYGDLYLNILRQETTR